MPVSPGEEYWSRRAVAETRVALGCNDPHIASLHVDLATRCVRQALVERERASPPPADTAPRAA
jgi:hypothetical protein